MEPKKLVRSTSAQIKILVDYMSLNKSFANGEFTGPVGARRMAEEWEKLSDLLRQHGADKSVGQWKQTWRDLKRKARRENAEANASQAKMGYTIDVPIVSDTTSKVLDTIGHNCSTSIDVEEIPIGEEPADENASDDGETVAEESKSPPIEKFAKKLPRKRAKYERDSAPNEFFFVETSSEAYDKEYEAIGANVACKLKRMSPQQRCHAELLINKVLIYGLQNNLTDFTDLTEVYKS